MSNPTDNWPLIDGVAIPPESEWCNDLATAKAGQYVVGPGADEYRRIYRVSKAHGGTIELLGRDGVIQRFDLRGRVRGRSEYEKKYKGNSGSIGAFPRVSAQRLAAERNAREINACAQNCLRAAPYGRPALGLSGEQLQRAASLLRQAAEILKGNAE